MYARVTNCYLTMITGDDYVRIIYSFSTKSLKPQQICCFKGMQVFQCNDGKVDRSSKWEFILRGMVSYFPNRSQTTTIP